MPVLRNELGHILPGQAPLNPSGRRPAPPEIREEVQRILAAGTPDAARRLVELTQDEDPKVALAASSLLLDRVFGKPTVSVDANVRTSSVQEAHLAALREITRRTQAARNGDGAVVIIDAPTAE